MVSYWYKVAYYRHVSSIVWKVLGKQADEKSRFKTDLKLDKMRQTYFSSKHKKAQLQPHLYSCCINLECSAQLFQGLWNLNQTAPSTSPPLPPAVRTGPQAKLTDPPHTQPLCSGLLLPVLPVWSALFPEPNHFLHPFIQRLCSKHLLINTCVCACGQHVYLCVCVYDLHRTK